MYMFMCIQYADMYGPAHSCLLSFVVWYKTQGIIVVCRRSCVYGSIDSHGCWMLYVSKRQSFRCWMSPKGIARKVEILFLLAALKWTVTDFTGFATSWRRFGPSCGLHYITVYDEVPSTRLPAFPLKKIIPFWGISQSNIIAQIIKTVSKII